MAKATHQSSQSPVWDVFPYTKNGDSPFLTLFPNPRVVSLGASFQCSAPESLRSTQGQWLAPQRELRAGEEMLEQCCSG